MQSADKNVLTAAQSRPDKACHSPSTAFSTDMNQGLQATPVRGKDQRIFTVWPGNDARRRWDANAAVTTQTRPRNQSVAVFAVVGAQGGAVRRGHSPQRRGADERRRRVAGRHS